MGGLSGGGRISVEGLRIANAGPVALPRLFARPLEELGALDENRLGARLEADLKTSDLALPPLAMPVTILNGLARVTVPALANETAQGRVDLAPSLTIDFPRGSYEARIGYRLAEAPKGWRGAPPEVALGWNGKVGLPPGESRRALVVSPLLNGLLAITLQRDLETIEAFDADARERAFHLRRSRSDALRDLARERAKLAPVEPIPAPVSPAPVATPEAVLPAPDLQAPDGQDGAGVPQASPG